MNPTDATITALHADAKPCRLRFENNHGEVFYFAALGEAWPHRPEFRLIARTVAHRSAAYVFANETEALAVLKTAGEPEGWEVEAV